MTMSLRSVLAVFLFEVKRFRKPSRVVWWTALALFPGAIVALLRYYVPVDPPIGPEAERLAQQEPLQASFVIFLLSGGVVCLLALLLSAVPLVQSEIEARTWIYLSVRPHARASLVAGKYAAAVAWSAAAAWIGLTLGLLLSGVAAPISLWTRLSGITLLSAGAYGALFVFVGIVLPQRGMVVAVAYTILIEVLMTFVPAVVNQFTVNYRLRSLLVKAMPDLDLPLEAMRFLDAGPAWEQVAVLAAYALALLAAGVFVLRGRELARGDEP
jgi:ABC-type transport system involved in multi-copper enzyme maturation permease subunit